MAKLIGITGKAGAGKDTAAQYFVNHKGFGQLAIAAPLKEALIALGLPEPANREDKEAKVPGFNFTWREAAQRLGTEWGRSLDPDIWVKMTMLKVERLWAVNWDVVISDVRFDNEAEAIRAAGGKVLHIYGRAADIGSNSAHASESGVVYMPGDVAIDNSKDLDHLHTQLKAIT